VKPQFTETYTFKTESDDGARLYVNGELLIDRFQYQGTLQHTGNIDLVAGELYDIELHYLEGGFDANVKLMWSSATRPEQIIPGARLYLPLAGANRRPRSPDILSPTGTGVSAASPTLQTSALGDLDLGQTLAGADWEIWTIGAGAARVWSATNRPGASAILADGTFQGVLSGQTRLAWNTQYEVRARHRDSSGSLIDAISPWRTGLFTTASVPPWGAWQASEFTPQELADPLISGEDADADFDNLDNLLEFAMRLRPKVADAAPMSINHVSETAMTVDFPVNVAATDLQVVVETSTQLVGGTWTSSGITYAPLGAPAGGVQWYRATVPRGGTDTSRFVRVAVRRL
jgi:hypothetical protein